MRMRALVLKAEISFRLHYLERDIIAAGAAHEILAEKLLRNDKCGAVEEIGSEYFSHAATIASLHTPPPGHFSGATMPVMEMEIMPPRRNEHPAPKPLIDRERAENAFVIDMQPVPDVEQAPKQEVPEPPTVGAELDPTVDKGALAEAAAAEFADRFRKPREERRAKGAERREAVATRMTTFLSRFDRIIDAGLGSSAVDAIVRKANELHEGISSAREKLAQKFASVKEATAERLQRVGHKATLAGLQMYAPIADTAVRWLNSNDIFAYDQGARQAGRRAEQYRQSQTSTDAQLMEVAAERQKLAAREALLRLEKSKSRQGEQAQVKIMEEYRARYEGARNLRSKARTTLEGLKRVA